MLIDHDVLQGIREGRIDRAFRRWGAPRVKSGSRFRTSVGVIEVLSIERISESEIGDTDAKAAGFRSRAALLDWVEGRPGEIYCIGLRYAGPDPRVELRNRVPDEAEVDEIRKRLDRLDRSSTHGPWTATTLDLIARHPGVRAEDLAGMLGREKMPFKLDVRKLKELGLTESLRIGYRLSPRGIAVVDLDS